MTDIEKKALAMINAEIDRDPTGTGSPEYEALCRAIEQHEAFRQEVSDAVVAAKAYYEVPMYDLSAFIITKPDPLFDVVQEWWETGSTSIEETTDELRAALAKRGGKIVWENEQ